VNPTHPAGPLPFSEVQLVGDLMPWVVGVLLVVLFSQLPRFGAHRDLLWTWMAAWAALVIGRTAGALSNMGSFLEGRPLSGPVIQSLSFLALPGQLTFLTLITAAAVQASGRRITGSRQREVAMVAILAGLVLAFLDTHSLARKIELFVTPVLFFGSAQLVLAAARGERERGMTFLAMGMVLFAVLSTGYQLLRFATVPFLTIEQTSLINLTSGYGLGFALALLGAAILVLVVQDSVLQVARTREEHLRDVGASEARLKRIIEAAGEAIVTFGSDRRIDLANAAAARLFRLPSGSVVGRRLDELVSLQQGSWDDTLAPVFAQRPSRVTLGGEGNRPGEEGFPLECTVGPVDTSEDRTGGVAILRDLTQRLAAEAERERFERRVAESEKMLAIGRVVSGVAHELNNPLAVVLGQSEQLVDGASAEELRDGLRLINEQAHRARHIVRDLLAFVRPREDRREPVDLAELARRVLASQEGEARSHGVTMSIEVPAIPPVVLADRLGLEQVVVNLIDNAMDAAGSGGQVRVLVGREDGRGCLTVEDDGVGVPDAICDRIFEPFFTTKPTGQGTGLGLAVSLGLLEHLGGSLVLENHPAAGIGARFVVRLPSASEHETSAATGSRASTVAPTTVSVPEGLQPVVLVIDDEPAVRSTLARIFTRWGWTVREEGDAAEALRRLGTDGEPAVILCDLKMPGMSGSEFYASLQARAPALATRVVFVTGDVVEPDTAQFLATAGRDVVEKPFTIAEIARTVEQVLARY
jgi:two-component system NtrC family sensor kinase